jgi:hypothetical protein
MNRKHSFFLWLILALGSCNKTKIPVSPAGVDVYITGNGPLQTTPPTSVARYWKNNKQFDLSFSTTGYLAQQEEYAEGIAVAGDDLYICGFGAGNRSATSGLNYIAKYWKNGVSVNLTDASTNAYASGIGIVGSDVYVTGTQTTADLMQKTYGKYWKNGVGVILPGGFPTGIAISGNDVYISGVMIDSFTERKTAVFWKNEIPVRLSDSSSDAVANAVLIDGSDIYIAGYDGNRAVYWKNQFPVYLTDGSTPASLISIAVEGTDVLAAGNIGPPGNYSESIGTYWKNGNPVTVGKGIYLSGIAVANGNTYVVGTIATDPSIEYPGYWINNVQQSIFDSKSNSSTSQILVIKH